MSETILHDVLLSPTPTTRGKTGDTDEVKADFRDARRQSILALDEYLSKGFAVVDAFDGISGGYHVRAYLLHMTDTAMIKSGSVIATCLTSIEVKSTFSKTERQDFDFFRCTFQQSKFVNIFDHPDKSRNTWNYALHRGWSWQSFQDAIYNRYPVPVSLSYDGEWYSLVDVIDYHDYNLMCEIIDTMNGAKDNEEE